MSVPQPAQPVIPYADASGAAEAVTARPTDDGGVEFVVAPPALWRLLVGPTALLLVVTGGIIVTFMVMVALFVMSPGSATLPAVGLVFEFGVWVLLLAVVWRIGRYGRLASVIRAAGGVLHVAVPCRAWNNTQDWAAPAIGDLNVEAQSAVPALLPTIRVAVVFHSGESVDVRIPWRGREALEPVERRVREVLGLPARDRA